MRRNCILPRLSCETEAKEMDYEGEVERLDVDSPVNQLSGK